MAAFNSFYVIFSYSSKHFIAFCFLYYILLLLLFLLQCSFKPSKPIELNLISNHKHTSWNNLFVFVFHATFINSFEEKKLKKMRERKISSKNKISWRKEKTNTKTITAATCIIYNRQTWIIVAMVSQQVERFDVHCTYTDMHMHISQWYNNRFRLDWAMATMVGAPHHIIIIIIIVKILNAFL